VHGVGAVALWISQWGRSAIEVRGGDRAVAGLGHLVLVISGWLRGTVEVQGVDRMVEGGAASSLRLSQWLWSVIERRGTDDTVEGLGRLASSTGQVLQKLEPRTLQHHLLVVVFWLVFAIGLSYWFV
jgi:hypothetical protein